MTTRDPVNVAASIRQRLLNLARQGGEEFQTILTRFALERLLYRIAQSPHRETLILKGAFRFAEWGDHVARPTRDLDLLATGEAQVDTLVEMFHELCDMAISDDGLEFVASSVEGRAIREHAIHDGVRLKLLAVLGTARIPLQVDIGFGDTTHPPPELITYPAMLDLPPPVIRAYRAEVVVAEKPEAMVHLGMATSRLKDFYDLWVLASVFEFDGTTLIDAIAATFSRRQTPVPDDLPPALSDQFASNPDRLRQWKNLMERFGHHENPPQLQELVAALRDFVDAPLAALRTGRRTLIRWPPGGPWLEDR